MIRNLTHCYDLASTVKSSLDCRPLKRAKRMNNRDAGWRASHLPPGCYLSRLRREIRVTLGALAHLGLRMARASSAG
jgi:hypothetical protein